jgi:hypothetical protein
LSDLPTCGSSGFGAVHAARRPAALIENRQSRATLPHLRRTSTLPAAGPEAAAPRRLQKRRLLALAEPARLSKRLADVRAAPGPLANARLGPLPASKFRERAGARFRPSAVTPLEPTRDRYWCEGATTSPWPLQASSSKYVTARRAEWRALLPWLPGHLGSAAGSLAMRGSRVRRSSGPAETRADR